MKTEFTPDNFEKLTIATVEAFNNLQRVKKTRQHLKVPLKPLSMTVQQAIDYNQELDIIETERQSCLSYERELEADFNSKRSSLYQMIPELNQWFIVDSRKYAVGIVNYSNYRFQRDAIVITDQVDNLRRLEYDSYRSFSDGNLLKYDEQS
ncbi:hypothetical protein [Flavobacterium sp. CAU 1735]|uniref:hypothetical protein n=1 Tax=Flavobacterium sp. CAU 1735 TaxID=3140361 RepID=UPI003261716B